MRHNFRNGHEITSGFCISPSRHLEPLLNRKILELPRVVLWFFSIVTIQSVINLSAKTGSYFVTVPYGHTGISPEIALRLSIAFGTTAESWLIQQTQYDLWKVQQSHKHLNVHRLIDDDPMTA